MGGAGGVPLAACASLNGLFFPVSTITTKMATPNYRLVFSGRLLKGFKHHEVQRSLAHLLKLPLDQAGHLIQGERFRINKPLEKSKAERLLDKIRARGAECSIEPVGSMFQAAVEPGATTEMETPPPSTEAEASPDEALSLDLPDFNSDDDQARPLAAVQPDDADQEESIVLETPAPVTAPQSVPRATERANYRPDDDSQNVGTFFERTTQVESKAETDARNRRKKLMLLAAILLVGVVVAVWQLLPMLLEEPQEQPIAAPPAAPVNPQLAETNRRLEQLNRSIKVWMIQYGSGFNPAQVTLERLRQDLNIGQPEMLDGWGTALRYEPETDRYRVVSAGPDKSFGTADDLKRESSINK